MSERPTRGEREGRGGASGDDERLLELLLGEPERAAELEEGRRAADMAAGLAEMERFLDRTRRSLAAAPEWSRLRERALVARVLARTTREDLSWRGELALLRGFVRQRLAASRALRLVAASLLVHLLALPVVAYWMMEDPAPRFRITIDPRPREEAEPEPEPTEDLDVTTPAGLARDAPRDRVENAVRRARYVLWHRAGPAPAAEPGPLEIELLAARSRALAERRWEPWLDEVERLERAGPLGQALWAEVLLDRYVLAGERSPILGRLLNGLALAAPASRVEARTAPLVRACLERARAYGLWEAPGDFDPLAVPDPLGAAWFESLARAAEGTPLDGHPGFERWMAWRAP